MSSTSSPTEMCVQFASRIGAPRSRNASSSPRFRRFTVSSPRSLAARSRLGSPSCPVMRPVLENDDDSGMEWSENDEGPPSRLINHYLEFENLQPMYLRGVEFFVMELSSAFNIFLDIAPRSKDPENEKPNSLPAASFSTLKERVKFANYTKISVKILKAMHDFSFPVDDIICCYAVTLVYIQDIKKRRNDVRSAAAWVQLILWFGVPAITYCLTYLAHVYLLDGATSLKNWSEKLRHSKPYHRKSVSLLKPYQIVRCLRNILKLLRFSIGVDCDDFFQCHDGFLSYMEKETKDEPRMSSRGLALKSCIDGPLARSVIGVSASTSSGKLPAI
eukprot:GEMP01028160.1.p1 GENE.GEMP01028160.1~~GEMP01028160.1.p1  ORF type:complete len:332 (+),score=40.99 GEMP01028160.1:90-1085(+)